MKWQDNPQVQQAIAQLCKTLGIEVGQGLLYTRLAALGDGSPTATAYVKRIIFIHEYLGLFLSENNAANRLTISLCNDEEMVSLEPYINVFDEEHEQVATIAYSKAPLTWDNLANAGLYFSAVKLESTKTLEVRRTQLC